MIRLACPADARPLAELAAATPGAPRWTLAQHGAMLTSPSYVVWAAVQGELAVGFATLLVLQPEAELEALVVHPAHQGQGHGSALLSAVVQYAATSGLSRVHLEVRSSSRAQALYGRLGFRPTGRRSNYYSNPVEDAILMQWSNAESGQTDHAVSGIIKSDYGS